MRQVWMKFDRGQSNVLWMYVWLQWSRKLHLLSVHVFDWQISFLYFVVSYFVCCISGKENQCATLSVQPSNVVAITWLIFDAVGKVPEQNSIQRMLCIRSNIQICRRIEWNLDKVSCLIRKMYGSIFYEQREAICFRWAEHEQRPSARERYLFWNLRSEMLWVAVFIKYGSISRLCISR